LPPFGIVSPPQRIIMEIMIAPRSTPCGKIIHPLAAKSTDKPRAHLPNKYSAAKANVSLFHVPAISDNSIKHFDVAIKQTLLRAINDREPPALR
jgi:hypothetical protein